MKYQELFNNSFDQSLNSELHCFGIYKPDAFSKGIVPAIESRIDESGLTIIGRRLLQLTAEEVQIIWPVITTPHVSRTVPYMTSAPVEVFTVEGEEATKQMMNIKQDFRARYRSDNPVVSVMHSTDSDEELGRCVNYFFEEQQND